MAADPVQPVFDPDADVLFDAGPLEEREPQAGSVPASTEGTREDRGFRDHEPGPPGVASGEGNEPEPVVASLPQPSRSSNGRPRLQPVPTAGDIPPQNLDAEADVLGAVLLANGALDNIVDTLEPDDFYLPSNGLIYRAMQELHAAGMPVDTNTLTALLERRGELDRAGGRVRILELARIAPASANVTHWADIVRETATLRGLITAGAEIAQLGWERAGEPAELVERAEQLLGRLGDARSRGDGVPLLASSLKQTADTLAQMMESGGVLGLRTGFHKLDKTISGLQPQNLVILAARPKVGKSGFATQIGWHVAHVEQRPVAMFSLEMSKLEITCRILAANAHVDLRDLMTGKLDGIAWGNVWREFANIEAAPLYVDDQAESLTDIRRLCRQLHRRSPLGLVIVDYLQLVSGDRRQRDTRNDEVAAVSRGLKLLARDLDVPVLALSQMNREIENRGPDAWPKLRDLRDSGAIEQDASIVIFLHCKTDEKQRRESNDTHVIVAANRNGPVDDYTVQFVAKSASFTETARMPGVMG